MSNIIWLKTAKVVSQNEDQTPNIQEDVIKLEEGEVFNNFVSHIHLHGFIQSPRPSIVKVMDGSREMDKSKYQEILDNHFDSAKTEKVVDYKKELKKVKEENDKYNDRLGKLEQMFKEQKEANDILRAQNAELIKPPKDETPIPKTVERENLERQAESLEIKFRADISDDKLRDKINKAKS